jgi:hypothetical protein
MSKYDYEQDFYGENDVEYMPPRSNNRERLVDYIATVDNNDKLCFVKKMTNPDPTGSKKLKIILFGSGQLGTIIRNAVTGEKYYGHKVGSSDEDLYFKTKIATGEFGNEPVTLFYENVEQYERHMGNKINSETKQRINTKQFNAGKRVEKQVPVSRFVTVN